MSEKWPKAISMISELPATKQFESILRPQACWSGAIQIAELLLRVIPRLEMLAGAHWKTEELRDLCEGIAAGHSTIEAWSNVEGSISDGKVVKKDFPEHAALLVLSRAGNLSQIMLDWIAVTIIFSIHTRDQLDRGNVKSRSSAVSQLDKAWRALRKLPGNYSCQGAQPVQCVRGAHAQLDATLVSFPPEDPHEAQYLDYLEVFWAHSLELRKSNRDPSKRRRICLTPDADEQVVSVHEMELIHPNPEENYSSQSINEHTQHGNAFQELNQGTLYRHVVEQYQVEVGQSAVSRAIRQRGKVQHTKRAFQMIPGSSSELTEYDVRILADALSHQKPLNEPRVALWLVLVTGRTLAEVAETQVCSPDQKDTSDLSRLCICTKNATIRVPIKAPVDRRKRQAGWQTVLRGHEKTYEISMSWRLRQRLKFWRLNGLPTNEVAQKLLRTGLNRLREEASELLSKLNGENHTQLTLLRVEKHLFYELASKTGDAIEACLLTGKDLPQGQSAGVYYHWMTEDYIQAQFRAITESWDELYDLGKYREPSGNQPNVSVGTDLVLKESELKKFFSGLHAKVSSALDMIGRENGLVRYHNALTNYVLMVMMFATGYRAVSSPIARDSDLNFQAGFLVISDKTDIKQCHSHIVPICETLARQLKTYRAHCDWVARQLSETGEFRWKDPSDRPVLFYLNEQTLAAEEVRPKTMVEKLSRDYCLPLNLNRHWLRGSLRKQNVPGEYVDAFMGHWALGADPFGRYSAMEPQHYRQEVTVAVEELLENLDVECAPVVPAVTNALLALKGAARDTGTISIPRHMRKHSGELLGDRARIENQSRKQERLRFRVEQILTECWPGFSDNKPSLVMSQAVLEQISQRIGSMTGQTDQVNAERYLHKLLTSGARKYDWLLPPLRQPPSVISREVPVTTPDNFAKLRVLQAIDERFWKCLSVPPEFKAPEEKKAFEAGELFYSVLAHSLCLSPMWWRRIPQAIEEGVHREGSLIWLDLDNADEKTLAQRRLGLTDSTGSLRRRIFPAPITQLLLLRWYRRWGKSWRTLDYQAALRTYLKRIGVKGVWKKADHMLAGMVRVHAALAISGALRGYAENGKLAPSIDTENFRRLIRQKRFRPLHTEGHEMQTTVGDVERDLCNHPRVDDDVLMIKKLGTFIHSERRRLKNVSNKDQRRQAASGVRAFLDTEKPSAVVQLLGLWVLQMLSHKSVSGTLLPPKTVRNYLTSIDEFVIGCAPVEICDPKSLSSEDWDSFYQECIDCKVGSTTKTVGRLANFHEFLENSFGAEPASITDEGNDFNIQARIVSPAEYHVVWSWIENSDTSENLKLLRKFALMLGYRSGMRRNEIYGLEHRDLSDSEVLFIVTPELIVRRNDSGGIKTASSMRRLQLPLLLSYEEVELVRAVRARCRRLSGSKPKAPLFIQDGAFKERVPEKAIFDYLIKALKLVTGDSAFRFHDLRHSAASYITLKALTGKNFDNCTENWLAKCPSGGVTLGATFQIGWPKRVKHTSKQTVWQTSQWMGHVSPGQTLGTYTHTLDWALRTRIWSYSGKAIGLGWGTRVDLATQGQLLDLKPAALEKFRQRKRLAGGATELKTLCDLTVHKFGKSHTKSHENFIRRPTAGRWEPYPEKAPKELMDGFSMTEDIPHLWAPYNVAYTAERAAIAKGGVVGDAELALAAEKAGIILSTARRWYETGLHFRSLMQNDSETEHSDSRTRPKVGSNDPGALRELHEKSLDKNYPQLAAFVAPYRSGYQNPVAESWLSRLITVYRKDPEAVIRAVKTFLEESRSSHSAQVFKSESAKLEFLNLLRWLGLSRFIKVKLRLRHDENEGEKVAEWAEHLGLPKSAFRYEKKNRRRVPRDLELVIIPEVPASYFWRGHQTAMQNPFWSVLRFVVFTVAVICVADVGGENNESGEEL